MSAHATIAPALPHPAIRAGYFVLGMAMVALGIIGAFVPVMPTTIFMILAAACFGRSSPRFERWLLEHPRFGPPLRLWREQRAMSAKAKAFACSGITFGFVMFCVFAKPGIVLFLCVAALMGGCALYLLSRPPPHGTPPSRLLQFCERHLHGLAGGFSVAIHIAAFALLLWTRVAEPPALPAPSERVSLVFLPARAPEQPIEEQIAPTPSVAASAHAAAPRPERPALQSPPLQEANWIVPPPTPAQPRQRAPELPAQEASVAAAPITPPLPPGPSEASPGADSWEARVMGRLERHRRYPNSARARREQGIVLVRVRLDRDGRLLALALEHSSGHPGLDAAALETFRRAAPLPPLPDDKPAPLELSLPVEFFMR